MSECSELNVNDVLQGDNKGLIVHFLGSKMYKERPRGPVHNNSNISGHILCG